MITTIIPTKENLDFWKTNLLPEKDVWFFKEKPSFSDVDILTIKEYISKFDSLDYNNAYCHWLVKHNAKYVIIDNEDWILSLTEKERKTVYLEQIANERGLIIEDCKNLINLPQLSKTLIENHLIISNAIWRSLSEQLKDMIVIQYAKEQDSWSCYDFKLKENHLNEIANTFINDDGCNCLATVAYAITKNKKHLDKWMNQKEFIKHLKGFKEKLSPCLKYGDIAVFYDNDNIIQHTCFLLNDEYALNKNGQSRFNPITIQKFEDVTNEWQELKYKIYAKNN